MGILTGFLRALKLPLKLLISKKKRKQTELEKKQLAHVRKNFAPTHYSWQRSIGKDKRKQKSKKAKKIEKKLII